MKYPILAFLGLLCGGAQAEDLYALVPTNNRWPAFDEQATAVAKDPLAANYYLVFDGSGSMGSTECGDGRAKIDVAKAAIEQFSRWVPATANLGLYVFDAHGAGERVPLGQGDRAPFRGAVMAVVAGRNTPLQAAMANAYAQLTRQAKSQRGYGEYHLVVVTDGASTDGDPLPTIRKVLRESPVLIETIGFCIQERHSLNQPGLTSYRAANDPVALRQGLREVLAEAPSFTVTQFAPAAEPVAGPTPPPPAGKPAAPGTAPAPGTVWKIKDLFK
jgi:hypothetical protein